MSRRATLIAKIKALLSKTVGNGCTEAEAMAALEKAQAMMADYDITADDVAFDGETVAIEERLMSDRDRVRERLCAAVGRFCRCRGWRAGFETIVFCGLASETIFAHWLLDMLADFVGRQLALYLERTWRPGLPRVRRIEASGFTAGCIDRLAARLHEMTPPDVSARGALIKAEMAARGIVLRDAGSFRLVDGRSHDAGMAAADLAQFNRPVSAEDCLRLSSSTRGRHHDHL